MTDTTQSLAGTTSAMSTASPAAATTEPRGDGQVARPRRTPEQIEADIEATRVRLAETVDELATRVKPANLARQAGEGARAQVVDEAGALRTGRVAALAGVLALLLLLVVRRRRRRSD